MKEKIVDIIKRIIPVLILIVILVIIFIIFKSIISYSFKSKLSNEGYTNLHNNIYILNVTGLSIDEYDDSDDPTKESETYSLDLDEYTFSYNKSSLKNGIEILYSYLYNQKEKNVTFNYSYIVNEETIDFIQGNSNEYDCYAVVGEDNGVCNELQEEALKLVDSYNNTLGVYKYFINFIK